MKFVLFHGSFGSPDENWFPQLKRKLEELGQTVIVPKFPVEDWGAMTKKGPHQTLKNQSLQNWFKTFEKILSTLEGKDKLCFVGHSLGPLFIVHVVQKYNIQLDCAIFVSPFLENPPGVWQFDLVNKTFYSVGFDFEKLKKLIPVSYVLHSDSDPYVNMNQSVLFGKAMDSSIIFVRKAGHMGGDVKLGEFPLVFDLCTTRLDLSLYQTYILHYTNMHSSNYIRSKYPTVIHLKPEDIDDEGNFHFKNLKKNGFATFMSGTKDWNPLSKYYKEGRVAAKRLENLTRVVLVEKLSHLKRKNLLEQIKLDILGGIQVYLCMLDDIKQYGTEPDFGIWDDDYTCTIIYDDFVKKHMKEFVLNSQMESLEKARKWKDIILKKAIRINNSDVDIKKFIIEHSA
ncbi:hypothetical protein COY90_01970 [Candidatus Roizmanbacteria bacterium CG_4_10_14_0_8_um_filter_39_9]|uniref:AB hydrolase-1 domain-containing protein n=1 Tax=Candidatus Roizmanbacteria bacterium CG_4_10_14_0_8_um_filter_39_9 TaxID=1974829 RepID=A0A2M7QDC4_9BACT|nr:MAG: hypothetical protein COY90_01970 [Candidatus Roizmanbacteria bacterium CG_4_10_14_0_8_um_filter_39_9]